ncbi:transposase [Mesorhizobium sp. M1348]|uniref:IS66 family transposase n=1 Tax=Mesorhizobium sp. M1348 TaxID=2957089 RepID=UPI00333D9348
MAHRDAAGSGPSTLGYAPGCGGEHAERFLQGFAGQFLQVDAYEGYDRLTRLERPQGPGCSSIAGATCADIL